jgi:hypothetical protein
MDSRDILRAQMFSIVDNQMESNDPPETKLTLDRLKKEGCSEEEARQFIAQCVAYEMFGVLKNQEEFNEERYIRNLKNLPEEPQV